MFKTVKAGVVYFLTVFALGFLLGTIRVLWLTPWMGDSAAVLLELPVILTASWVICTRLIDIFAVPEKFFHRLAMGLLAFMLLMSAELALAILVFGQTVSGFTNDLQAFSGTVGLAGQTLFALFPILQVNIDIILRDRAADKYPINGS